MKTELTKSVRKEDTTQAIVVMDAKGQVLGRFASKVAFVLRGKNKPSYTPHVDTGDRVVVINAAQIKLTGNKLDQKMHHEYSGFRGGMKSFSAREILNSKKPEKLVELAVKGMIPNTVLGRKIYGKLRVYPALAPENKPTQVETKKEETKKE